MSGPKRTEIQRENDYRRIADLYLQGKTQVEIADIVGLDQSQVSRDLATVQARWRNDTAINLDEAKQVELSRIDTLERTYWDAWERSLEEKVKTRTEQTSNGGKGKDAEASKTAKASVEKETLLGNPAYLAGVMNCIERRCKLLGLDAPTKVAPTTPDGKESIPIAIVQPGIVQKLLDG